MQNLPQIQGFANFSGEKAEIFSGMSQDLPPLPIEKPGEFCQNETNRTHPVHNSTMPRGFSTPNTWDLARRDRAFHLSQPCAHARTIEKGGEP